jgi:hypothetical protein
VKRFLLASILLFAIAAVAPHAEAQKSYTSTAVTTAVSVQTSLTHLYGWYIYNPNASACSLDLFNTATVTLGTTVPYASLVIPATSGANLWIPGGLVITNALSVAAVTAAGGGTTCGTGMTVDLFYQ